MSRYFMILGILAALIMAVCLLSWLRLRRHARFRANLNILLVLTVLASTIPLALLAAALLTRSAQFAVPDIGPVLEQTLNTLRSQSEKPGLEFLRSHSPDTWDSQVLSDCGMAWAGSFRAGERMETIAQVESVSPFPFRENVLDETWIRKALQDSVFSALFKGDPGFQAVFRKAGPDHVVAAAYEIPPEIIDTKEKISETMRTCSALSILKQSILEKKIIMAAAVSWVLLAALAAAVLANRLSAQLNKPIENLVAGMKRISSGDLSARIDDTVKGEFLYMANSFNAMADDLKTAREQLVRTERIAAWQQVARRVSHEIKNTLTPLSIALQKIHIRMDEDHAGPETRRTLDSLEAEFRSLKKLAAEFSELARMPVPRFERVDLNALVQSSAGLLTAAHPDRRFHLKLQPGAVEMEADQDQIRRLIGNLLLNAVEASSSGSEILIKTAFDAKQEGRVLLEILDSGKGMDSATLERCRQAYFTTKTGGTGLGLAIVEKILEDHGGGMEIESSPGEGTRVRVRLRRYSG
ncbi:HAMP domain-containing protein [bacterium]|nr:HAMP domain-containing protein [bacterium]